MKDWARRIRASKGDVIMKAELGTMWLLALKAEETMSPGLQAPSRSWESKEMNYPLSRGRSTALLALWFCPGRPFWIFLPLELEDNNLVLCPSTKCVVICYGCSGELVSLTRENAEVLIVSQRGEGKAGILLETLKSCVKAGVLMWELDWHLAKIMT